MERKEGKRAKTIIQIGCYSLSHFFPISPYPGFHDSDLPKAFTVFKLNY